MPEQSKEPGKEGPFLPELTPRVSSTFSLKRLMPGKLQKNRRPHSRETKNPAPQR
jgi:hypothetical protein